jgi:deoxycytidylate deaminase
MSDNLRRRLLGDLLKALRELKWLSPEQDYRTIQELVHLALVGGPDVQPPLMRDVQIMDLLEFGRSVHAEMAAITDAANRGISIAGSVLYTTTFPCHLCARHIVSSGIKKVVYIEPFPKSLVFELYSDSISVENVDERKVSFVPFVGVAPRMFLDLFSMAGVERKNPDGTVGAWDKGNAVPKFTKTLRPAHMIIAGESAAFRRFAHLMRTKRLMKPS